MRDWNRSPCSHRSAHAMFQLSIIPMRDWNARLAFLLLLGGVSIINNPYEGLKRTVPDFYQFLEGFQLSIIPMRDWNDLSLEDLDDLLGFQLSIIPMRDWNKSFHYFFYSLFLPFQLSIIPMRDWNWTQCSKNRGTNKFQLSIIPMRDWNVKGSIPTLIFFGFNYQ